MNKQLTEKEQIEKLTKALARTRFVWNTHIHWLCAGHYPHTGRSEPRDRTFKGSHWDRLHQVFRVMDHEVRQVAHDMKAAEVEAKWLTAEEEDRVMREIAQATGLTDHSHTN